MTMRPILVFAVIASAIGLRAQVVSRPLTAEAQVAAAEEAGASFPRARGVSDTTPRTCTMVRPDQIVFPSTRGNPADFSLVSGEFVAGSISFGWGETYEQAKMPLTPRYPEAIGRGLTMTVVRIDPPGEPPRLEVSNFPEQNSRFFPTWPRFATPGRWMMVATAGVNWGCFVLDRPVR
jgi:hypothetical protein